MICLGSKQYFLDYRFYDGIKEYPDISMWHEEIGGGFLVSLRYKELETSSASVFVGGKNEPGSIQGYRDLSVSIDTLL